jgi:hypothetical protein
MLRLNHTLRLSPVDLDLFEALTGPGQPAPTTVADYNQRLRLAVQTWNQCPSRDERYLGVIANSLLLDEDDCTSVIDQSKLQPIWH